MTDDRARAVPDDRRTAATQRRAAGWEPTHDMHFRSLTLLLAIVAIILAACGSTVAESPPIEPSPTATPSASPSTEPSEDPSEEPSVGAETGTITMVDGVAAGGPGASVSESIAANTGEPMLVNGVLLMDTQGTIWLCDAFAGGGIPSCGDPSLRVIGYPEDTSDWDMAHAEMTGLQEGEGILWFDEAQIFGVIEP